MKKNELDQTWGRRHHLLILVVVMVAQIIDIINKTLYSFDVGRIRSHVAGLW